MNQIHCLGLNFLATCSSGHVTEHFLFNFETAISSLAIVIAIYALILENRFRVRIVLKRNALKRIIILIATIVGLTFIGSILPLIPGYAIPLLGYPTFWELLASLLVLFTIYISFNLFRPIKKLTKKQANNLTNYAPHATIKYHGAIDLLLKELEYFWKDFLSETLKDPKLRETLAIDFSQPDFLAQATKSQRLLIDTIEFISDNRGKANIQVVETFLSDLFLSSLTQDESIIVDDLNSSYKPILQHIIRERKLAPIILGNATDLFFLRVNSKNLREVFQRMIEIFHMYLGRKYYYNEDTSGYSDLIETEILKRLLDFFKESLYRFNDEEKTDLLSQLDHHYADLSHLNEEKSTVLAEGIYEILENYASGKDWSKNEWKERLICIELHRSYIECNEFTKNVFEKRLLEKIVGTDDKKSREYFSYNLIGYYPMMIPIYFFIYGYTLFSNKINTEHLSFHLSILKKMKENLPKMINGKIQQYFDRVELPKKERDLEIVKNRARNILSDMFPPSIIYNNEDNSITYYFSDEEAYTTILLDETYAQNRIVFKD